jgi:hypothetical protein
MGDWTTAPCAKWKAQMTVQASLKLLASDFEDRSAKIIRSFPEDPGRRGDAWLAAATFSRAARTLQDASREIRYRMEEETRDG